MHELKENKKSLESQKIIYKSLRRILKKKALSEVKIQDIKDDCGISRSTFYRNFNNVVDVLDVMLEYFYNRYLEQREGKANQLEFFFEYWQNHKDLIRLLSEQNIGLIKNCMKRHEDAEYDSYLLDIRLSIMTSILSNWSIAKDITPKEMEEHTKKILNKNAVDILLGK